MSEMMLGDLLFPFALVGIVDAVFGFELVLGGKEENEEGGETR
jgi:hypothetical protein